jgi:hypothetical protein
MTLPAAQPLRIEGGTDVKDQLTAHLAHATFSRPLDELEKWMWGPIAPAPTPARSTEHISALRERLDEQPILESPQLVTVQGVFYPAFLLTPGLWERSRAGEGAPQIDWRAPLQEWLFAGFEQWAPSWDLNPPADAADDRPLYAQIGHEDEAFSLLLLVTGPGAAAVRSTLLPAGELVCRVEVTCWLLHRRHLGEEMPEGMRTWRDTNTYDYCLHLNLSAADHGIERIEGREPYSGYLWKCVAPKEWLRGKEAPELVDAFFVWEHTDLASEAAREYGLDALAHKLDYIERRFGQLELIQKSLPILAGEPLLPTESFYSVIASGPK